MLTAITSGLLLGLAAGLAPGPLMTLIVAHTLQHGPREGCKIALAPLLTDAPIILIALAIASRLAHLQTALGLVSIAGGLFVLYLALETLRAPRTAAHPRDVLPRSWLKGTLTNLLSPHPWLFWMTIGAATLARALATSWAAAAAFLGVFYLLLIGTKLLLALVAASSRASLSGHAYHMTLRILGVVLVVFALVLLVDGWSRLR